MFFEIMDMTGGSVHSADFNPVANLRAITKEHVENYILKLDLPNYHLWSHLTRVGKALEELKANHNK